MRTAFVTGGTGFLGRHLVEQLVEQGWAVTCLHRPSSATGPLRALGVRLVTGDLHDADAVAAGMPEGVDAVFHVAANTSTSSLDRDAQIRDNVGGTRAVVEAALRRKARRFLHTSSIAVWGQGASRVEVLYEALPMQGDRSWILYERTKWQAEQEVRAGLARGLDAVFLNPPDIVGRYDTTSIARLVRRAHHRTLPAIPPGTADFVHAADVARAHLAAVERGRTGENYLLPGAWATYRELVVIVGELSGRPPIVPVVPAPLMRAAASFSGLAARLAGARFDLTPESAAIATLRSRIESTKAREELGFATTSLHEMVEDSWRWLLAEGHLA